MTRSEFLARYQDIFEHSPWIVERAYDRGGDFLAACRAVIVEASDEERLSLIRAHPELAAKIELTAASTAEQMGAGLRALTAEEFQEFAALNAAYREKFGFPFVICVREHTKTSILENFRARLGHDSETEERTALQEILKIAALRLAAL
jgi:OHCU decarboxylase